MEYPRNSDDAQKHILQIRREKGLDGPQSNTSDLENALVILSEQLYQKSTHFLSELIQNADDNSYQMAAPTLVITFNYSSRTLRIDCNEIGFSKANVEAICKIGRSTKSKTGNATRYIGEKGIGFKSVFKVADEVYLHSGYYSFKFDRNARLGMIAPTWAEFPDIIRPGNTSVLLCLSDDYYPDELEHELRYLDPRLLLFLRKLQQIEVMSFNRLGSVTSSVVQRRDVPPTQDGAKMVNLHQDAALTRFKIIERPVKKMPPDPKRQGCTTSEVLLAFPVGPEGEPWIAQQKVYAFLPIRDYGFKFLIQADFLLIASREDIDTSSMWNRHLLAAIPDAFLQAVLTFNKGELRYQWMRFLPDRLPVSGFFEQLGSNLMRCLSRADVIESWSGALTMPRNLKYIDKNFRDFRGRPLIVSSHATSSYISERYDILDIPMLERLGVRPLLPIEFVVDLQHFIFAEPDVFIGKETTWHSQLAAALLLALYEEPGLLDELCKLPIIPLKTGQWVASRDRQTYFASADEELNVPEGTLLGEIDPAAVTHLSRRNLFRELGAKPYSMQLVCNTIVREQLQANFEPGALQLSDYIERTRFLFDCGWKNYEGHDLWVVTEAGTMKRGSETYMQSLKPYSAQDVLVGRSTTFNFLHREYHIGPATKFGDWTRWLQDNLLLAEYPRLVVSLSPRLILAQDLRVLRKEDPLKLLLVLRDRWEYYCDFFISPDSLECIYKEAKSSLRSKVAAMEVPCFGGHVRPLGQTTLPTANIISGAMEAADFANLPEPEDPRWHFLSHFGVVIDPGIDQFVQCLRQMKGTAGSVKRASNLYQQLQALANEHSKEIRNIFDNEELILIPSSTALKVDSWVKSSTCAWSGPKWLRKTPLLDDIYGGQSSFFCETLGIRKTTWRTIISEAECIHASDDLDYITRVFRALSTFVEEADTHSQRDMVNALSEAYIFPIDAGQSGAAFDYLSSVRDRNMWFIADRIHLKESFHGLVPLLALKVDAIDNIAGLIHELGLRSRLLTEVAGSDVQTEGSKQVHGAFTAAFRAKTPYIARILPASNTLRNEIVTKLCSATIYASETVSIRWTVKMEGVGEIEGRADAGRVKITHQGDSITIFLRHKDADNGIYPLDLREGLAKLCVLQDASQIRLLDFILNEGNSKEIDEELSRRGYPQPSHDIQKILDITQPENLLDAEYNARNDISVPPLPDQQQFVGHNPNTKRFRSRRVDDEAPDNIQAFLAKFNLANSFREQLSQPWADAGADNLLAHACRLDDIDPWNLLPRNRNQWDELLKAKGKPPGVATRTFWSANRHVQGKHFLSDRRNVRNAYAAVVLQDHRRNMVIKISNGIENMVTDDLQFAAEHHVSRIFERRLGVAYIAGLHWTSPLRSRAGHLPYFTDDETTSTFTIEDTIGAFTTLLQASGNTQLQVSAQSRVFHVEVIASEGDLGDKFCMDPEQVQKSWRCHTEGSEAQPDIFVLARVVNIRTKPRVALFVDPWRLHREGHLNLESASQYEATLSSKVAQTSCIYLEENTTIIRSPSPVPMEKSTDSRHGRWFHKRKQSRLSINQEVVIPQPVDTSFTYQRLQVGQTRLLELKHGNHDTPLSGEVHHVNVERCPPYNAVSYVWGSATKSYTLSTSQGPVHITASLYSALKRLRRQDETVHLWVDAICINQDDDHEKATQIRMLPNIFRSAEIVLCWIGEEHDDSSMAIETLLQIRTLELAPQKWPAELPPIPASWKDGIPPVNDMIWWSIQNLFEREWFSRIWVIQEVVLARELKLLCGKYEMDWEDVLKAVEICLEDPGEPLPVDCYLRQTRPSFNPVHTLGLTRRAFENKAISARFSLLSLLDVFSHARSTKACDKLFALLGMASDANAAAFDPDYSSSLVVILRRFAHEFVRRGNAAALLYRAGSTKSVSFASWIPNWVANHPCRTISTWRGTGGVFTASGRSHLQANVNPVDANILQIAGTFVDSIVRVSSLSQRGKDIIMLINDAHAMIDQLPGYPTGETLANVKMKALIGSAVAPCIDNTVTVDDVIGTTTDSNGLLNNAFEWKDDIVRVHRVEDVLTLLAKPKRSRDESYKYWLTAAAFFERLCNGRFFITSRGYVGVAPDRARVGDQICIVQGASVPFVLRQVKHHELGSVHSLLGETYVHGIMYGEALGFEDVRRETIYIK